MNYLFLLLAIIALIAAAFFMWRYMALRRHLDEYARALRQSQSLDLPTDVKELEDLSTAVHLLAETLELQLSTMDSERNRLATVLDQMTDGVLIADAHGEIQFANPAARKLFETSVPVNHTVAEVVRHHQLVEAWRRC
ncbi:MAG TPA: PAS domain-containing protein, partial [Anaerolineales bacterium]|nr:PAS domain-containing protein [Anaerolineales bacterium]